MALTAKRKAPFRRPSASEQLVPEDLQLRLLSELAESARSDALIVEHHYLHTAKLVGEHLRYAATYRGEWLAGVSFSAAASHRRYRDQFIVWSPEQRRRRLPLVVNNARFLILPDAHYPHLASRLLTRVLARLSDDWLARLGAPGRARRDFRQSGVLPRHHLQGQRLERIGRDLGVRPAR